MIQRRSFRLSRLLPALALACVPAAVLACASCGCTLSSDWDSQGFTTQAGLRLDVRYDLLNQDQLRSGRGKASAADVGASGQEVEKFTRNNYLTVGLDYSFSPDWGVNVQLPWINRNHSTLGTGSDGSAVADAAYDSRTSSLGDVKVVGRYQGFSPQRNLGLMLGLKLPTGSHTATGVSTDPANPGAVAPIDRGLQPGTGTTDAILGVYYFDTLNKNWDWFGQATVQAALNSSDDFKPGTGYNLNLGVRYMGYGAVIPQLQLNTRYVKHDTGVNADTVSTGGTLMYLSPGLVVPLSKQASVYGFVQLPVYQDVRGVQLTPRHTASIGVRFAI